MTRTSETRCCAALVLLVLATGANATWDRDAVTPSELVRAPRPELTRRTLDGYDFGSRTWVYFTDKGLFGESALDLALRDRARRLDPRAAERRGKVLGERLVDFHDLPVVDEYVDRVEELGAVTIHRSRWLNAVSVRGSRDALRRVAAQPFVAWIAPVGRYRTSPAVPGATLIPSPPKSIGDLFDYGSSRGQLDEIGVVDVHRCGYSGQGVIVAMLDTGFDWDQPAFEPIVSSGRLLAQYDFVDLDGETHNEPGDDPSEHAHGTLTWSALAGLVPGELVGPAYGASFLLAKTEDVLGETPVEEDNWVAAAEWADDLAADVISSSLIYIDWYQYEDMDGLTAPITLAADLAVSRGIVVCNSAGNEGTNDWFHIGAPGDGFGVITVGASRTDGATADFSSHGPTFDGRVKPEVVARGDETYCAAPEEWGVGYLWVSGTSMSCPLVAGSAALLLEANPGWTPTEVRDALMATADNAATPDNDRGWGRIDVAAAIEWP